MIVLQEMPFRFAAALPVHETGPLGVVFELRGVLLVSVWVSKASKLVPPSASLEC